MAIRAVSWDLDHLRAETRKWSLQVLDDMEIRALPWIDRATATAMNGTMVLWEDLDQIHAAPAAGRKPTR